MKTLNVKSRLKTAPSTLKYSTQIKSRSGEEVECACPKATRGLLAIMNMHAVNGGAACHWGGPAAMAESMSALHTIMFKDKNWFENYNFVNDIGHAENGIYALKANWGYGDLSISDLWKFRSIESKLTGHGESHLYADGVLLSNGPLSSAVPQAQGLAMADKVAGRARVTICSMSDGAAMEGEAKESFAAIPGLAAKGKMNPFVLIVSDNNTKLSGRIDEDSFDMAPTFRSLETLGWNTVFVEKGNDLQTCYQELEKAIELVKKDSTKPVALVLRTVKGYGVKSTEVSSSGGHGYPLKAYSEDIYAFLDEVFENNTPAEFKQWAQEATVKPESKGGSSCKSEKAQGGIARGAIKAAKEGLPVFSISSDLQGSTGMASFQKEFPNQSVDIGIAEANMVSTGAGYAKAGFIPIVDTFTAFGVTKGNLPFIMASLSQCPMIAVFSHAGFQDAADGASHQSLTYIAAMSAIPHTNLIQVSCAQEGEELMYQAIKKIASEREAGRDGESYIFFVGRENYPIEVSPGMKYELGKNQILRQGSDVAIAAAGPVLYKAIAAADELAKNGIKATVINQSHINHYNNQEIIAAVKSSGNKLITVEDHQVICGLGSQLVHNFHQAGYHDFKSCSLGVKGEFGQSAYLADELYAKHGLDEKAIVAAVKSL